jgi:hypothetical protein
LVSDRLQRALVEAVLAVNVGRKAAARTNNQGAAAARPEAPSNCTTTGTRIVRRSSNRDGNDRYLGTGRASLRDQRGTPSLPGSVCAVQHLFAPDLRG